MIEIEIPGRDEAGSASPHPPRRTALRLEHLVLDYNGTLAVDGEPVPGVKERLVALSRQLEVHVVTADTFGRVRSALEGVPCELSILPPGEQDQGKLALVRRLGPSRCVCVGNGENDRLMLAEAALGVAVILAEGACVRAVVAADVVCTGILDALSLLEKPLRLVATLRC
jgi:soluble P-type ATPase